MHHRFPFAAARSLAVLVLVLTAAPIARAGDATTHAAPRAVAPTHAAPMRAGMVIGIDPETGLIGPPTPQQMERLGAARAQSASATRPAPVYHAGGRISLDVRSWMREYSIVRIGADGKPARVCVSGRDAATEALHQTPATPAAEDR